MEAQRSYSSLRATYRLSRGGGRGGAEEEGKQVTPSTWAQSVLRRGPSEQGSTEKVHFINLPCFLPCRANGRCTLAGSGESATLAGSTVRTEKPAEKKFRSQRDSN